MLSAIFLYISALAAASLIPARGASRSHHQDLDKLNIETTSGTLRGFINSTAPNVRQFLGVPYAEPPLGSLRFFPPVPKSSTRSSANTTLDATAFAPSCMQQNGTTKSVYTEYLTQFLINGGQSEDCLYLNVYAPLHPTSDRLPVFIYIPGGGFTSGGANSLYKIPDKWVDKTQSFLVITINYRLNVFGYPVAAAQRLNAGLLDQRLAVEWARDNVAAFGGDPSRMVLWGQSAGGGSVGFYGYAHWADPIVRGLIADSGTAVSKPAADPLHSNFSALAAIVGCGDKTTPASELACMQDVDAAVLEAKVADSYPGLAFTPLADGVTVFANTTDRIAAGYLAPIPLLTGSNANEGAAWANLSVGMTHAAYALGLSLIVCPEVAEIANRVAFGYPTFRYEYAGNFSNVAGPLPWVGATHSSELPLVFGTHWEYRGNSTPFEWAVSAVMQGLWESFLEKPEGKLVDPGTGFVWERYSEEVDSLVVFGRDGKTAQVEAGSKVDDLCA